ncbi:MAG: ATPase component of various ABC-type transport system with duplicated ATPase domain [Thermoleophilia bacterium]|nr:ATPase component of various ABC-type transport system with duplicated ATPase domain [Thermoleophilia bacterium]
MALSAGAAFAGWVAILVTLNVTGHPLIAGATFVGLTVLALRQGMGRLVVLALVIGAGLLLVVPGVAIIDGSFRIGYAATLITPRGSDWFWALCAVLRIPAQVLAAALLALVPARLLLASAGRLSPDTALLAGLAARLRPLLGRDVRLVRDELASRGLRIGRGAPLGERARGVVALWEAIVSGLLDRAFQTAAALETRGYGVATPTVDAFTHAELHDGVRRDRAVDRIVIALAVSLVAGTIWARSTGQLAPPAMHALGDASAAPNAAVTALAFIALMIGLVPLRARVATLGPATASAQPFGTAASPAELRVTNVSMTYPAADEPSLLDASLVVAPGELVVITGASGSGKSTLLDVVTGVAPRATGGVRRGEIRLGAHVMGSSRQVGDLRVAAVFQDPEAHVLVGQVAEEVAFGLRHAGVPIAAIEQRVLHALDQLDVRHLARRDCATLSGGELQRVLLAAALAVEPAVLVLDEPTSQVDATSERRFWDAVDHARRTRGIGVLAAEHRLDHVLQRADRIVVFAHGRIVADTSPAWIDKVAPQIRADAYADLAPAPIAPSGPARLSVRIDRLDANAHDATDAGARHTLLRGLAFAAPAGSIITLEGPNGTGKSTLLRAIRGLHDEHAGVLVDGRARGDVGGSVQSLAFLSQGAGAMLPGRTVRHAIEETCRRLGIDVAAAHDALNAAALADRLHAHPSELSVGERQRLALVAATAHRPPVWLLDEPTRGMDATARRWVAQHLLAHARAGGVALVATHDPALAAAIATHRLRLDLRTGPTLLPVPRDEQGRIVVEPVTIADARDAEVEA